LIANLQASAAVDWHRNNEKSNSDAKNSPPTIVQGRRHCL